MKEEMDKMMKEILEKLKESDKECANNFDKRRDKIVNGAKMQAENAQECFVCFSENGCQINGSVVNLLAGYSSLTNKLKKNGISAEMIKYACKLGLENDYDEDEDDDEDDEDIREEMTKKLDELKNNMDKLKDILKDM